MHIFEIKIMKKNDIKKNLGCRTPLNKNKQKITFINVITLLQHVTMFLEIMLTMLATLYLMRSERMLHLKIKNCDYFKMYSPFPPEKKTMIFIKYSTYSRHTLVLIE